MSGDALVREEMLCTSPAIAGAYRRSEIREGEIVCAIRATVGKVLLVPPELHGANLTQGTARISPNSRIDKAFLLWAMRDERSQREISLRIKGTTFMEITLGDLRGLPIAAPTSKDEQREIGVRMNAANSALAAEAARLAKLRQQKQGLMQALLTPPGGG
jgi:type I restriction enzyme S subunit